MTTAKKAYTGQLIVASVDKDQFVTCPKCLGLIGLHSTAWYDTADNLYKHYKCLSPKRLAEIVLEERK